MRNTKLILGILMSQVIFLSALTLITPVFGGTGSIRIHPEMPMVVSSPADLSIWIESSSNIPAYDPHIFLVMTDASYKSLTGNVMVSWASGSETFGDDPPNEYWQSANDGDLKLPPGTSNGAGYNVATLKSHLGIDGSNDPIWWAFFSILDGEPLYADEIYEVNITVTLPATNQHMMVYILGKSAENGPEFDYDMRVPPTAGTQLFLIPEVPYGTIAILISMLLALILFINRPFIK